jgi:hypothetical protein
MQVLAYLPLLFLHDRGARGQWLPYSVLGSTQRETGLFVDGLDLRDPISGMVDLNMLPTLWLSALRLELAGAGWGTPRTSAGATLVGTARKHTGNRPLSHVGYENGDWGVRAVDVELGMKLSRRVDVLAGALLAGFDGFGPRQQHDAQRIRATATVGLGKGWSATYLGLLTKSETEETLDPLQLALRTAVFPVWKDRRLDHALTFERTFAGSAAVQTTVSHTELKREFHDYPRGLHWIDQSQVVTLASSASMGGARIAGLTGAMVRYAGLHSPIMGDHRDVEASVRCGLRMAPGARWRVQFVCDALARQDTRLYLAPSVHVLRLLGATSNLTVDGSREVYFPSFQERFAAARSWGKPDLRPWVVHRAVAGVTVQRRGALWFLGGFARDSGHEVLHQWASSDDSYVYLQSPDRHRQAGLVATASAGPRERLVLRGGLTVQWPMFHDEHLPELPEWHGWFAVAYGLALFHSDLELTVRAFCQLIGERCDAGMVHRLPPQVVPGGEVQVRIMRNALVWARLENLLGREYQTVWGYPMPTRFFTWGVNWSFVD